MPTSTPQSTRTNAAEASDLLNTVQTAHKLNLAKRTLQQAVAERRIGFVKYGRSIRFTREDIARFIESNHCQPVGWKLASAGGAK